MTHRNRPEQNKYHAKRTVVDGHEFPSRAEAKRYAELKLLRAAGEIYDLHLQPPFELVVNGVLVGTYTADFGYHEDHQYVVEEVKGFKARDWSLRSKLFMACFPKIELRVNGVAAKRPKAPKRPTRMKAAA